MLAWAVREGVTNVIRHSRARRCEIEVTKQAEAIRLMIRDDGSITNGGPNAGSGLAGLAERASAHGATLDAGPRPDGGFQLVVTAPIAAGR